MPELVWLELAQTRQSRLEIQALLGERVVNELVNACGCKDDQSDHGRVHGISSQE